MKDLFNKKRILILLFATALLVRLLLIVSAHHGDLNNNISWGTVAYEKGFNGFYEAYSSTDNYIANWPYSAPNQPPLTIYLFTLGRAVWEKMHDFIWYMNWELLIFPSKLVWFWDEKGMDIVVKLPSLIADLGIGYLIFNYFRKKDQEKTAIVASSVWLFNPAVIYNSSVWGQTDSIVNFIGLIGIISLTNKNLLKFSIFMILSLLFKPSLSVFIPVLLTVVVLQRHPRNAWIKSFLCCLITVIFVSIFFHPKADLLIWLYELYTIRFIPGEIGFLTANSFNLWWLVDPGKVLDNTVYFGLSARVWGYIFTLSGMLGIIHWLSKKLDDTRLFAALAMAALVSFLFMTRIHERYLYPFFPVATILVGLVPRLGLVYFLATMIHLINLYNYFWVPDIPKLKSLLLGGKFPILLSIINLSLLPLFVFLNKNNTASVASKTQKRYT